MVLIRAIILVFIAFLALSLFSTELRDKILGKARDLTNKLFVSAPPALDKIVVNPLKNQLEKVKAGRETGGIETV